MKEMTVLDFRTTSFPFLYTVCSNFMLKNFNQNL